MMNSPAGMKTGGVILAGGMSRRMGTNKAFLKIGGIRMIDKVYGYMDKRVDKIAVNGDSSSFAVENWDIIPDLIKGGEGPMIGIWSALDWAKRHDISWVFTVPVDTPFLPVDTLSRLLDAAHADSVLMACAASRDRHHPVVACWHVDLYDDMKNFILEGGRKIDHFVRDQDSHERNNQKRTIVPFADQNNHDPFMNINRPEDIEKAQQIWSDYYA